MTPSTPKSTGPVPTQPLVTDCPVIALRRIHHDAGNLTPVQEGDGVPFGIQRVFYIYDIPGGEDRGAHAHRQCHQFLIAASGSFEVALCDGKEQKTVFLNRPYFGLHIPPGIWAAEKNFSSGAVCLVFTSHRFDPEDYIRDYEDFLAFRGLKTNDIPTP